MIRRPPRSTLSLHDALPICELIDKHGAKRKAPGVDQSFGWHLAVDVEDALELLVDRKSTRLNSSHANISYADFCLKKKRFYRTRRLRTHRAKAPTTACRATN